jgi:hypothetical protein
VFNELGSIFGGTIARKKFGGPEMYAVASYTVSCVVRRFTNELMAGVDGKRKSKIFLERPACSS